MISKKQIKKISEDNLESTNLWLGKVMDKDQKQIRKTFKYCGLDYQKYAEKYKNDEFNEDGIPYLYSEKYVIGLIEIIEDLCFKLQEKENAIKDNIKIKNALRELERKIEF